MATATLPTPPPAPVTTTSPSPGTTPAPSRASTQSMAVRPAVPTAIVCWRVRPSGLAVRKDAGTRWRRV
jgi:hypothetical protein